MADSEDARREAFEAALRRYGPPMQTLIAQRVAREEDRKDLFQEIAMAACAQYMAGPPPRHAGRWLFGIMRNKLADFYRMQRLARERTAPWDDALAAMAASGDDPRRETERALAAQEVADAAQRLSPRLREVVLLRLVNEMSFSEIAEALAIREDTARARASRGFRRLAGLLRKRGYGLRGAPADRASES